MLRINNLAVQILHETQYGLKSTANNVFYIFLKAHIVSLTSSTSPSYLHMVKKWDLSKNFLRIFSRQWAIFFRLTPRNDQKRIQLLSRIRDWRIILTWKECPLNGSARYESLRVSYHIILVPNHITVTLALPLDTGGFESTSLLSCIAQVCIVAHLWPLHHRTSTTRSHTSIEIRRAEHGPDLFG